MMIGAVCLCVVMLRAERVRLEARVQASEAQLIRLTREVWRMQLERARLCTPDRIDDRARRMGLEVLAPLDAGDPREMRWAGLANGNR